MDNSDDALTRADNWIAPTPPALGILAVGCGLPAFFWLAHLGQPERGIVSCYSIALIIGVCMLCRPLIGQRWFVAYIIFVSSIHAIAIVLFKFPRPKIPMIFASSPFVFSDMALILFGVWLLNKKMSATEAGKQAS